MATEAEILTKVSDLLDAYSGMLAPSGGSKLLTLDRAAGTDAALSRLRQGGAERWRYGMLAGDDDFVLQWSDGSELNFVDRLRIDGATGAVTIAGLALDGASFADTTFTGQSLFDPGSAAAPAIAAAGDVDTGLFFPAANALAAAVGGTEIWRTTAAGLQVDGAVVVNGSNYKLDFADGYLRMQTGLGRSIAILIDSGAVDRNDANPWFELGWSSIGGTYERLSYIGQGATGNPDTYFVSDHGNIRLSPPSGSKVIITRPLEMFDTITAPDVLIGTTTPGPASRLRVNAASGDVVGKHLAQFVDGATDGLDGGVLIESFQPRLALSDASTGANYFDARVNADRLIIGYGSKDDLFTRTSDAIAIDNAGNLLIGTTVSGASKLRVVDLPTSSAGLSTGDIWNDAGTLKVAA